MIDLDTWIISDTHFGHDNIIRFCKRPVYHDCLMRTNWFETVKPDDTILHLGDVGFGKKAEAHLEGLPGRKLLIKGNHDGKPDAYYEGFGFEIIEPFNVSEVQDLYDLPASGRTIYFMHDPLDYLADGPKLYGPRHYVTIHGHIHNNGYDPRCPEHIDYRNVSVEVMDYRPVRLRDILYDGKYQSRKDAGINEYDAAKLKEHA
jgi:calcineurin-like phosphoesterase family protein